ncbi:DUF3606 domain-containing protein [Variovorax ginsengisoli]|uniref:DUF3606 domain-containing protein n=2 Tax=Variovorax guangxiensis TaxID=1775474 RepID=A0A502DLU6_9BURK|nr:DUF3606 domain-containing protein [Variovorax guangxiensis]TPG21399.1 DUF3606 domain-containing protein [Variovorax ginsengisoli]TPG25449.1 DUF3606 domain-containing protein [Variovorax guangxiensis]
MPEQPVTSETRGRTIQINDLRDVRAWCNAWGCSEAQLRLAVRAVGNSADAVHAYLLRNP